MRKLKRTLALFLTLATLLTTVPMTALAADVEALPEDGAIVEVEVPVEELPAEPEAPVEEVPAEPEAPVEEVSAEPEAPVEEAAADEAQIAVVSELPAEDEMVSLEPVQVINPLYGDLFDSESVSTASDFDAVEVDAQLYASMSDAVSAVRSKLKARSTSFSVTYTTTGDPNKEYSQIVEQAMEHTGNPTEGDYLKYQWSSWSLGSASGYYDRGSYYEVTLYYSFTYLSTASQEKSVDSAVNNLYKQLNLGSKLQYDRIKAIYQWMCDNISYDYYHLNNDPNYPTQYTAYGAIIDRTCVCQGYAVLFYRLALTAKVDARVISGYAYEVDQNQRHAWNIVKLDSKYYNLDATWDAGNSSWSWFLKCPNNFDDSHIRHYGEYNGSYYEDDYTSSSFNKKYPMGTSDYQIPYTPKLVSVENVSSGVKLTWNKSANATSYDVYRKVDGGSWSKIKNVTSTSYTNTGAVSGHTYTYTVRARTSSAQSGCNATGLTILYLSAPTITKTINLHAGIQLTWKESPGCNGYNIYRKLGSNGSYSLITAVKGSSNTTYTDTSVQAKGGNTYTYKVMAYRSKTKSAYMASDPIVRMDTPSIKSLTQTSNGVVIKWNTITGCNGYNIYRKQGDGSYVKLGNVTGSSSNTFTDTSVKGKKGTYTYKIEAYRSKSKSAFHTKSITLK